MSFFPVLEHPDFTEPYIFDRSINQGRRPLKELKMFVMKKIPLKDYFKGLILKLYRTYQNILQQFYYFDVTMWALLELCFSLFIVVPIQLWSVTYRFLLKPDYYYISRLSIDDTWYASVRMMFYKLSTNIHAVIVFMYMSVYAVILAKINQVNPFKGSIDKTNNLMDNQLLRPYCGEATDKHIIYVPDGPGTQFLDIFIIQNFINNMEYVNMHYFGFEPSVSIKYHRTHPIVQSLMDERSDVNPYTDKRGWFQGIMEVFYRPLFMQYGVLNSRNYRDRLVEDFVARVRNENPKTFTIAGLSMGGVNAICIASELLRRREEFCDVVQKMTGLHLVGAPVHFLSDFAEPLNTDRPFPIYQILSPNDLFGNIPLTPGTSEIGLNDIYVVPIRTMNLLFDPHVSLFINPSVYEMLSHFTVADAPHLKKRLLSKPSNNARVYQTII
ncbi:hypothetical protein YASMINEVIRUS_109 [Yasminevirus sp. GU-2018]|uniref:Uncharacterized protein n=1 Tax=Yasminevirus sp. GU-2018 TaxID=2420051 RepID=A0A5K0U947_9VIRU|nr:hypothetical protein YASMINEVIRUS_109 [Yasminevirus sp. GU-2018]